MSIDFTNVMYNGKCVFCEEHCYYLYNLVLGNANIDDLVIHRTKNFIVLPDIAPLVEGYLLIMPINHYSCFGDLLGNHLAEFNEVKEFIFNLLSITYTKPIFFEHGPAKPKQAGCCVDHAHFHCIPINAELSATINGNLQRHNITQIQELVDYTNNNVSYLYYENNIGSKYAYPLNANHSILPSQYLRMVVAANQKLDKWDWREMITDISYRNICKNRILNAVNKLKHNNFTNNHK